MLELKPMRPTGFLALNHLATFLKSAQSLVQTTSLYGGTRAIGGGWRQDSLTMLLSDQLGGQPTPAAGTGARFPPPGRRKPPSAGTALGAPRPRDRSICRCSHCSSPEHANCPLRSWTAVSCQREIRDPFSAGTLSFLQLSAEWPQRNRLVWEGWGRGGLLVHPNPHREGKRARPHEEATQPPDRHLPEAHRQASTQIPAGPVISYGLVQITVTYPLTWQLGGVHQPTDS